jgi:hypothetical protein
MNILADDYPDVLHCYAYEQTTTFRNHLDQLTPKQTPAYTDWWNDRFLP